MNAFGPSRSDSAAFFDEQTCQKSKEDRKLPSSSRRNVFLLYKNDEAFRTQRDGKKRVGLLLVITVSTILRECQLKA